MTERLLVYRVRSWRHDCYLRTLEEALAHARLDFDRVRPGQVAITRERVSRAFLDGLPKDCDHPGMPLEELAGEEELEELEEADDVAAEPADREANGIYDEQAKA
jgi:hypothetical protein